MTEYGYLIVRNPGPLTDLQFGGLTGEPSTSFESYAEAKHAAHRTLRSGDQIYVLVVYEDTPTLQLAVHVDALEGTLFSCSACGRQWPTHELLDFEEPDQGRAPKQAGPAGECPECGGDCWEANPRQNGRMSRT